jgi:predicted O-linked N-acetylglucosamine transferase (SPINDLY family)
MARDRTEALQEAKRLFDLGNTCKARGRLNEAIAHYERALALDPENARLLNNLGLALAAQGKIEQAIRHYERALALYPDNARALNNLGLALAAQGRIEQAITHYQRALALSPDDFVACNNLGNACKALGRIEQAITHYQRALALNPGYAPAHHNLGSALALQGRMSQAIAHYERARALWPGNIATSQSLLLLLNYSADVNPRDVYAAHRDFARRFESPLATAIQPHENDRSPQRRLRIGYVSSDFRQHSVGYFVETVITHHDRAHFEVTCYANHPLEDAVTERLKSRADRWRRIDGLPDEQVARQIRDDRIDVLLDLNGHCGQGRLLVFARKPAPVQVTWLGYPNTTGLSGMDYRLTDGFADPVGLTEHLHSEKLLRLPECFLCYQAPRDAPPVSGLPGRETGHVTLGSFNNLPKVTREVKVLWAAILQAIPGARLILKNPALGGEAIQEMTRREFVQLGIAPQRLDLLGHDPSPRAHLERYHGIDIGLDPFPYNGTTTTCEALWMGVPVVTLAGTTHAGRVGVSLLSNLGLDEFVTRTPEDYLTTVARLSGDLDRLATLRSTLRARMAASPLTDGERFTRHLECAYRTMWQEWCAA